MTDKEYQSLYKDLCARLPYGVVMTNKTLPEIHYVLSGRDLDDANMDGYLYDIPYLRPMSEIANLISAKEYSQLGGIDLVDWYNANHIDYRGLIEKGLAIKVTEENNPYKE